MDNYITFKSEVLQMTSDLLDNYKEDVDFHEKILEFYKSKIPFILLNKKKRHNSKLLLDVDIKNVSKKIFETYFKSKYIYNNDSKLLFEIVNNEALTITNIDVIYLKMKQYIPPELYSHKYIIFKNIKKMLKECDLLSWKPNDNIIQNMVLLTNELFNNLDSAKYFMFVIGSIIAHEEKELFTHLHLWYGYSSQQLVKFIEELLYQKVFLNFKCNYSIINNIKTSYQNKYDISHIWYLYIPEINKKNTLKNIYLNQEIYLIACYYIYKTYGLTYWENHPLIKTFQNYNQLSNFFKEYYLYTFKNNEDLLLFDEIKEQFKEYLKEHHYPENLLKIDEFKTFVNNSFTHITIHNTTFYKGYIKENTCYLLFKQFCQTIEKNITKSLTTLYDTYKIWHLQNYNDEQMINNKLFEIFLQYTFPSCYSRSGWTL